jgi:glycine dehydrogenase subunit 2
MIEIAKLADSDPESIKNAPQNTPVSRLSEVKAARDLNVTYIEDK